MEVPGVDAIAHLQPVSRFNTESPGTDDRDLGLPKMLNYCVLMFVVERRLTS